jgi:hypothetical protein
MPLDFLTGAIAVIISLAMARFLSALFERLGCETTGSLTAGLIHKAGSTFTRQNFPHYRRN